MQKRAALNELGLSAGKKARLRRILFDHGLRLANVELRGDAFLEPALGQVEALLAGPLRLYRELQQGAVRGERDVVAGHLRHDGELRRAAALVGR